MKIETYTFKTDWNKAFNTSLDSSQTLVLLFSSINSTNSMKAIDTLHTHFPKSKIIGASSVGNIIKDEIVYDTLSVVIIHFQHTNLKLNTIHIDEHINTYAAGTSLVEPLISNELKHLFILSGGIHIDGTELTRGINSLLPKNVYASGGVASDIENDNSWVLSNNSISSKKVVVIGFYGNHIHIGSGCQAGLEKLGLNRRVTDAKECEILTLDGNPALTLYKKYLGAQAHRLVYENFLFPLAILDEKGNIVKIRSVIDVDEEKKSLILNDSITVGTSISLMATNFNRLVEGAYQAAQQSFSTLNTKEIDNYLVIPISCIGRKNIMSQRIEEELFAMMEGLPSHPNVLGFYSNGEISPIEGYACTLQNHTMTLTTIYERQDA